MIDIIEGIGNEQRKINGVAGCYASDEFYILAERPIPSEENYDGYPQIENGVGLMRSLQTELEMALSQEEGDQQNRSVGVVTGVLAADFMDLLLKKVQDKFPGLNYKIYPIVNHFFGERITVSGLVTGGDILSQLSGEALPERLILPSSMLRAEQDLFLDSISIDDVREKLDREIDLSTNDGFDLLDKILGR